MRWRVIAGVACDGTNEQEFVLVKQGQAVFL
jgi:hypothetical protein